MKKSEKYLHNVFKIILYLLVSTYVVGNGVSDIKARLDYFEDPARSCP